MKVTLQSTTRIVALAVNANTDAIECRVWEGVTENGVKCQALIPRISVHKDADASQFEAELKEHVAPSSDAIRCFPLRMILKRPTIGQIVIYCERGREYPAIVTAVASDPAGNTVHLTVFPPSRAPIALEWTVPEEVPEFANMQATRWKWPPHVIDASWASVL